jgi:hypothetical protein
MNKWQPPVSIPVEGIRKMIAAVWKQTADTEI